MRFRPRWPLACLLLPFILLTMRLLWILGVTSTSWQLFGEQWIEQTRSLINWEIPVPYQMPAEQATHWVQQSHEIKAVQHDPQVALGAAWMLDTPLNFYLLRHYYNGDNEQNLSGLLFIRQEWDYETVKAMEDDFEPLAREACLKQSELATRLAPENKCLWRNRALLLFQLQDKRRHPLKLIPRQQDWQDVLEECARHDSENALYDYLAAIHLWSISCQTRSESSQIDILDKSKYQQSHQKLKAGLRKPFLDTGYTGEAATFAFLSQTGYPFKTQISMAETRKGRTREQLILANLLKMLQQEFISAANQKEYAAAAKYARHHLRISEQLEIEHSNFFYLTELKRMFLINGLVELLNLHKADPGIINPAEYEEFSNAYSQALLNKNINDEVLKRIETEDNPNDSPHFFRLAMLSATSLNVVFITLACAILTGGLSWLGTRDPDSEFIKLGFGSHLTCWLLGTGISLILWGLFAAEIVPIHIQYWLLPGIIWTSYILLILSVLYLVHAIFCVPWPELLGICFFMTLLALFLYYGTTFNQLWSKTPPLTIVAIASVMLLLGVLSLRLTRKFFSEKSHSLMISFLICGLVLLLACIVAPYGFNLASVDHILARIRDDMLYPVTWRDILGVRAIVSIPEYNFDLDNSTDTRVWLVWYWLAGELFAVFFSLTFLLLLYLKRQSRNIAGGFPQLLQNRKRITLHRAALTLSKSCAVVALLFSLVYLAVTPEFLKSSERQILKNYRILTDANFDQKETEALQTEIEADPIVMDRIRKQTEKSLQWFKNQPFPNEPAGKVF